MLWILVVVASSIFIRSKPLKFDLFIETLKSYVEVHSLLFVKMINYCWTFTHDRPTNLGFSLIVVISVPRLLVMLLVPADEIIVGDLYRYLPSLLIIHNNRIFHP